MKRCPKCHLDYIDNSLEFCLEDGSRLLAISAVPVKEIPTYSRQPAATDEKTVSFNNPPPETAAATAAQQPFLRVAGRPASNLPNQLRPEDLKQVEAGGQDLSTPEAISRQAGKALEIAPIFLSLAHNWWQWIYLNDQYYPLLAAFLLSANFLMWLLLLATGAAAGLLALKFGRNKGFAYAGLVILAINLLLFLVPKR